MPNIKKAYVRIAIFDADGVVTSPKKFATDFERDFGTKPEAFLPFFEGPFPEALVGKADLKTIIQPYLKGWNWNKSVDEFLQYWFRSEDVVNDALLQAIEELGGKGIKCYLATNQEKYRAEYMRNKMNLKHWFDGIFSSSDLGCQKPDKEFFIRLLKRIDPKKQLQGQEILFWDDSEENVKAAKDLKLQAYQYIGEDAFMETMSNVTLVSPRFLHKRK
jgi:putative hydrolase of the HAD superfamily